MQFNDATEELRILETLSWRRLTTQSQIDFALVMTSHKRCHVCGTRGERQIKIA